MTRKFVAYRIGGETCGEETKLKTCQGETVDAMLGRYFGVEEREALQIESELMARVTPLLSRWVRTGCIGPDEMEDRAGEARLRLLRALRNGRSGKAPRVRNFWALAKRAATHTATDAARSQNPVHLLRLRLRYLTTAVAFAGVFARWQAGERFVVGLAEWEGQEPRDTVAYRAYRIDDTAFIQGVTRLCGVSHPGAVPLPKLIKALFRQLETPLYESDLLELVADLLGVVAARTDSLEDLAASSEKEIDDLLPPAPQSPEPALDWQGCWEAVQGLSLAARRALLLAWEPDMLRLLTGCSVPHATLASVLEYEREEVSALWPALPLGDGEIAERAGVSKNYVQVLRHRGINSLRRRLRTAP